MNQEAMQNSLRDPQQELPKTLMITNFLFISSTPKEIRRHLVVYFVCERNNNNSIQLKKKFISYPHAYTPKVWVVVGIIMINNMKEKNINRNNQKNQTIWL